MFEPPVEAAAVVGVGRVWRTVAFVGREAFEKVGSACAEDADAALDVGIDFATVIDRGVSGGGSNIGVEVFIAGREVDVDHGDVVAADGVVDKIFFQTFEKGGAGVFDGVGDGGATGDFGRTGEVDVERVAKLFIIEADDGLVVAGVGERVPGYLAVFAVVCEGEFLVDCGLGDELVVGLEDKVGDSGGDETAVGGMSDVEAVGAVFVEPAGGGGKVEWLQSVGEGAGVAVAECKLEGNGVDERTVAIGEQVDLDGTLGVVDGIGDGTVLINVAFAKEAALDADEGGVVILVEDTVDDGYFAPFSVGREFDFAGGEEQRGDG